MWLTTGKAVMSLITFISMPLRTLSQESNENKQNILHIRSCEQYFHRKNWIQFKYPKAGEHSQCYKII